MGRLGGAGRETMPTKKVIIIGLTLGAVFLGAYLAMSY